MELMTGIAAPGALRDACAGLKIADCPGADAGSSVVASAPHRTGPVAALPPDATVNMQDR